MMEKEKVLNFLNRDKLRVMAHFNHSLGNKPPTNREANFLTFAFKIEQPDEPTLMRKYIKFQQMVIRLLRSEKAETVTSIGIVRTEEPAYIKYRMEVTVGA